MAIVFGADGWQGVIADTFTIRNSRLVCQAMADVLVEQGDAENGVVVGYDTRFLSEKFARECAQVLAANEIPVYWLDGVTPTSLLSFAVRYFGAASGLMVTGGQKPADWNGMAWKGAQGAPALLTDLRRMAAQVGKSPVQTMAFAKAREAGLIRISNCNEPYLSQMLRFLSVSLQQETPLHVVVDTMHGAAGGYLAKALEEMGCLVTVQRAGHDAMFGGVVPEPVEGNLQGLREKVVEVGADFGLATDGEGVRLAAVDGAGRFVSSQMIFSLLTLHLLRDRNWSGKVALTTAMTTGTVEKVARLHGAEVGVVDGGFSQIGAEAQRENVLIAGEESGRIAVARHLPDGDALFAALLLVEHVLMTGKTLADAVNGLRSKALER